eukprot:2720435-Alexandrium_andersonii.AAC.1
MAASASIGETRWNTSGWATIGRWTGARRRGLSEPSLDEKAARGREARKARPARAGPSKAASEAPRWRAPCVCSERDEAPSVLPGARGCVAWRRPRLVTRCPVRGWRGVA